MFQEACPLDLSSSVVGVEVAVLSSTSVSAKYDEEVLMPSGEVRGLLMITQSQDYDTNNPF